MVVLSALQDVDNQRGKKKKVKKGNKGTMVGLNGEFAAACVPTIAEGYNCSLNMHAGCGYRG